MPRKCHESATKVQGNLIGRHLYNGKLSKIIDDKKSEYKHVWLCSQQSASRWLMFFDICRFYNDQIQGLQMYKSGTWRFDIKMSGSPLCDDPAVKWDVTNSKHFVLIWYDNIIHCCFVISHSVFKTLWIVPNIQIFIEMINLNLVGY